jgi:nucleotide-binding universal stress UspA family protein
MRDQITRILVPVDFSPHAEGAIEFAATIAQRFGGSVELLHVVEDPFVSGAWSTEAFTPNIPELMDRLIADARTRLEAIAAAAAKHGVAFAATVETGEPARTIIEHAKTGAFDLIVMSTHGRTGLTHLFLGSVAEHVLRTAPCPVLTVRAATKPTSDARADVAIARS